MNKLPEFQHGGITGKLVTLPATPLTHPRGAYQEGG